jgi:hypothetical protein
MTLKKILQTRPEIAKIVYNRYPTTKMERRGCAREKARLDWLRWEYGKKLMDETPQSEKQEYSNDTPTTNKPV